MDTCHYCGRVLKDKDNICPHCGYNSKTDTLTPSFIPKKDSINNIKDEKKISPGVKVFALIAIIVLIISLSIKYNFVIGEIKAKAKMFFSGDNSKASKVKQNNAKNGQAQAVVFTDVRSFQPSEEKLQRKDKKIEGIFYDAVKKSYCVINGQLLSEGDTFQGIAIKRISKDSVEVVEDGKIKILRVEIGKS